jgi:hypothetical protein
MSEGRTHELFELKQEDLHKFWPFLLRGITDIKRTLKPHWIPEDIYSALRAGQVSCLLARRAVGLAFAYSGSPGPKDAFASDPSEGRLLGFLIYNRQLRPFSFESEAFIWCAWNLPIKEWLPDDDMRQAVTSCFDYVANVARTQYGTSEISWITRPGRAKAFQKKFGWRASWVTMSARV